MKFAKLEEGNLIYAPRPLELNGVHVFTDDLETHLQLGYKELVLVPGPEAQEGYHTWFEWEETDTQIIQNWQSEWTDEVSADEALNIIFGGEGA